MKFLDPGFLALREGDLDVDIHNTRSSLLPDIYSCLMTIPTLVDRHIMVLEYLASSFVAWYMLCC